MSDMIAPVVYVISKVSYEQVCVSVASLINKFTGNSLSIYFLYDDPEIDFVKISEIVKQFNHRNIEISVNFKDVRQVSEYSIFANESPKEVYFRLFMPYLVPAHQALYLDGDTLIEDDLYDLLTRYMDNSQLLLGVRQMVCMYDYGVILKEEGKEREYISSGVCMVNLDEARRTNYVKRATKLFETKLQYISSLVNYLGFEGMVYIPVKYHVGKELINPDWKHRVTAYYPEDEVNKAIECPTIIHYSGEYKPNTDKTTYHTDVWWGYWRQIFER